MDKEFNEINTPLILSDCNIMEFPNDVKVSTHCDYLITEGSIRYEIDSGSVVLLLTEYNTSTWMSSMALLFCLHWNDD